MRKRIIALSLAVCMLFSMAAFTPVAAADDTADASAVTYCGLDEHVHAYECFERELICDFDLDHKHGDSCKEKTWLCGFTQDFHEHNSGCSFEEKLICGVDLDTPHTHGEACYARKTLCGLVETDGHVHENACFAADGSVTCTLQTEAHKHTVDCYNLECTVEAHKHIDSCYKAPGVLDKIIDNLTASNDEQRDDESSTPTGGETDTDGETGDDDTANGDEESTCTCNAQPDENGDMIHAEDCALTTNADDEGNGEQTDGDEPTCTCDAAEGEDHAEDCALYAAPECTCGAEADETGVVTHNEDCALYIAPECTCGAEADENGNVTHAAGCALYVGPAVCNCGTNRGIHTITCPVYVAPQASSTQTTTEFGRNPSYVGVGPLLSSISATVTKSVPVNSKSRIMLFSANEDLANEADNSNNSVDISTADGAVSGTKTVTDTGKTNKDDSPIYQIELKAESTSHTTGESCDFVMVLDMSYSMTGANLAALKEACKTFVNDLYAMSNYSRVAIVTYGGDRNVNKYYISNVKGSYLTAPAAGSQAIIYEKYSDATEALKQQWYMEKLDDGYVQLINEATGQALTANVNGVLTHETWPTVITKAVSDSNQAKWKMANHTVTTAGVTYTGVIFENGVKCANGHPTYLDLNTGNTANGTGIGMWETPNTPTMWKLEAVTGTDYETYYWTDSTNTTGYSYRTDHSAADSAFLLISENEGKQVNSKLIAAIDALKVYAQSNEGSHPGEAMEKATRIYQNVRYDDANDICEFTDEHYSEKKRGVLYFADGTPSPTDAVQLKNYPDNNEQGTSFYGVTYDFEETYKDAQDATNWSIVLKSERGETVTNSMDAWFINKYSIHEKSEYYDIGGSTVTGCGATVYVLGTNLPTMDISYAGCKGKGKHTDKNGTVVACRPVDVLDGKGNTVTVCYSQVYWRSGGLFDSYDSRSNEFFYRLSSHRKDGSHLVTGNPMNEIEQTWLNNMFNSEYCKPDDSSSVSAWNGRYPDIICRNQTKSYFVACDNQQAIKEAFQGIAQQTGRELKNLTMIDNITEYFVVTDEAGNPLNVGDKITMNGLTGTLKYNEATKQQYIEWDSFNLNPGDGTGAGAEKFDFSFYVVPKDGFLGGNHVETNDGAILKDENGNEVVKYPDPEVDVEVKDEELDPVTVDAKAGSSFLEHIPYEDLVNMVTVTVNDDINMKLDQPNYGLEAWQNAYVNFKIALYDTQKDAEGNQYYNEQGNPVALDTPLKEGDKLSTRRDHKLIVKVWIWSKYDKDGNPTSVDTPPADANTAETILSIDVHYPTFVFADAYLYYGQPIGDLISKWYEEDSSDLVNMTATKYLRWYTDSEYQTLKNPTVTDMSNPNFFPAQTNQFESDEPTVYFKVNPIDETVPYSEKYLSSEDNYYGKFTQHMGKDDVAMNVRVYYKNVDDSAADADDIIKENALRHAFFLHVDDEVTPDCDIPKHTSGGKVVDKNNQPIDANLKEFWIPEFYIHPKFCELTITKTGGIPGETYVFDVYNSTFTLRKTPYSTVSITVDEQGNGSVTLYELPIGSYRVEEHTNWSWRHTASAAWTREDNTGGTGNVVVLEAESTKDSGTVKFTNTLTNNSWFNGFSKVVVNIAKAIQ